MTLSLRAARSFIGIGHSGRGMKVIAVKGFGGPEVLEAMELDEPIAGPGQVVVDIAATSVNPIDLKLRSGKVPAATAEFPAVLHSDLAGTIIAVGEGVEHVQVGDEVWGCGGGFKGLPSGALAEKMVTDSQLVAVKPKTLDFAQAAALPLVAITSYLALKERLQVSSGDNILIHGGAGGVGSVAIQIAKSLGCKVFTTVSGERKAALAKALGADETINHKEMSVDEYVAKYTADGKGFDCVFDTVGGPNLDASFAAAAKRGKVATIASRSTHDLSPLHGKSLTLHAVFMVHNLVDPSLRQSVREILDILSVLVEEGKLKPLVESRRFDLNDVGSVREAHAYLESGKAVGKIVLTR